MKRHKHILDDSRKFIPYKDEIPLTKYWQYPCKKCKEIIPEYGIPYIWVKGKLVLDKNKITIL